MKKELIRVLFTNLSDGSKDYIDDVTTVKVTYLECGSIVWDLYRLEKPTLTLVSYYHKINYIEV